MQCLFLPRLTRILHWLLLLLSIVVVGCSQAPLTLVANGPFSYSAVVDPPFERVAVLVTITSKGTDDLAVNPADFLARDSTNQVYPANPTAAIADAHAIRIAHGLQGIAPLPVITLRQNDVLTGYVVFDVPSGTRPTEVVWRQSDTDYVAHLTAAP